MSRPAVWLIQRAIQWVISAPSPEAKQPDHEADRSSPPSVQVKNWCSCISTRLYALMFYKRATLAYFCYTVFFFAFMTHLYNVVNFSNYSEEEIISNFVGGVYHDRFIGFSQYLKLRKGLSCRLCDGKFFSHFSLSSRNSTLTLSTDIVIKLTK